MSIVSEVQRDESSKRLNYHFKITIASAKKNRHLETPAKTCSIYVEIRGLLDKLYDLKACGPVGMRL